MRFACTLIANQADVLMLIQPLAAGQFQHLLFIQGGYQAEIIGIEILLDREGRLLDPGLEGIGGSLSRLQFNQTQQELMVTGILLGSFGGQFLVFG